MPKFVKKNSSFLVLFFWGRGCRRDSTPLAMQCLSAMSVTEVTVTVMSMTVTVVIVTAVTVTLVIVTLVTVTIVTVTLTRVSVVTVPVTTEVTVVNDTC